ncbi:KH domain-containing protein At4g18375-like [Malania oleifera]|uniref:KH domain-containing protein At4g18375-like n=1 Tax=Malania oleifera TaxID=397392 RepID=UPI0025ADF613|nr:KH domain-containing protein At4g18375-like [Malania oleifera]XP_057965325.1 KH domain-containing protein At4g18375-like [Malania oleifera]XP_057965328.1 KH domain-containing protein At4g18375-like [Malania oleifera]
MEGNKRNFFKKRLNSQFKKKGGHKKGKWHNSNREQSGGNSHAAETVYRILCPSRKIGSVIGKGGNIVKALREETQSKITVADSVPGSDERVIIIYSSSTKVSQKQNINEDLASENEEEINDVMQPHCAAQDALLKVHERIVEEDRFGGMTFEDENENNVITTRLLVPNNMVGCLLGKRGDVIQKLRSETGASIRVLPADHLPSCAMNNDELVQISGKPEIAKRALYEVSTLLHQNPRKDKPPLSFPTPYGAQNFHPGDPMGNMPPPGNPMWSHRNSSPHGMPPVPWMGGYENQPHGFGPGGFDRVPPGHGGEALGEFNMKILCSAGKIGGVIGKGGFNVRQLQQETGANIHVEDASAESEERVIRVSSLEALWNPRSQTIEAILQLQNKTSEFSEKSIITTRLLVPSSKVGCILGQGGHIINEMRRRTQADIRVYSKDDKPKCASDDEELVQISGNFGVAKDALAEIASRLRTRCLRDANAGVEPPPVGPVQGFGPPGSIPGGGPPPPTAIGPGSSGGYELLKGGGHEYERHSYPVPPTAPGYPNVNNPMDVKIPNNSGGPVIGSGGSNIPNIGEMAGTRVKLQDPQSGGSECVVEIRGSSDHLNAAQSILQSFISSGGSTVNTQQGAYPNMNSQQGAYLGINAPPQGAYPSFNTQQGAYPDMNAPPQGAYQDMSTQQASYQYRY